MLTSTLVSLSHGGTSHSHPTECSLHLPRYPISFSHSFPDRPDPPETLTCITAPAAFLLGLVSPLSQRRILGRAGLVVGRRWGE